MTLLKMLRTRLKSVRFIAGSSALLMALSLSALCLPALLSGSVAAQSASLTRKERLSVFNRIWRLINDRYYDPALNGLDWNASRNRFEPRIQSAASDEEYYELLEQMVSELRDAHTFIRHPWKRHLRDKVQTISVGAGIYEVEGLPVITSVEATSEMARAGVQPGMQVLTIDGQDVGQRIVELRQQTGFSSSERAARLLTYNNLLDGQPQTSVSITLQRYDVENSSNARLTVNAMRQIVSADAQITSRRQASGYGYIKLTRWLEVAAEPFRQELLKLRDTSGLIIDLRGNGGGHTRPVLDIAGYFFPKKTPFGRFLRRTGKPVELEAGREGAQLYKNPVVILINEGSASGSEMFAGIMQESGRARIVGQQSCGCLLAAEREKLAGGGELSLSIYNYLSPAGRRLEGNGVMPDVLVPLRLSDLQSRRDAVLEAAEQLLGQQ
jgi:carboxyl-terminal processing protease